MIRSLRRKLVIVATAAFVATTVIIGVATNVGYSVMSAERTDAAIEMLYENDGVFPDPDLQDDVPESSGLFRLTEDTPFQIRYFIVYLDAQGAASDVDTQNIASVDDAEAIAMAQSILELEQAQGYYDFYRFHVYDSGDGGAEIIIVDCFLQMQIARNLIAISVVISLALTLIALAILIPLSGLATRPFARNLQRQQRFVTDASHELKTPLAIISANIDLMEAIEGDRSAGAQPANEGCGEIPQSDLDNTLPDDEAAISGVRADECPDNSSELAPWIESTRAQVSRLNSLVHDLIELSRGDEGRSEQAFKTVNLSEIVFQASLDFETLASAKGLSLSSSIAPAVHLQACTDDLVRLCSILMDNAVKYCDKGGHIEVCLEKKRRAAELRVSNPCSSITSEDTRHFFDRFWRADEARTRESGGATSDTGSEQSVAQRSGGYGLGLPIAQTIVCKHKGKIEAQLENNIVTLAVSLPLPK